MKNYRIKTNVFDNKDAYITANIDQTYDFIEVLSLKINQDNTYPTHTADYGALVGRCYMNNGLGIPNVRVSIFIPIKDIDKLDPNFYKMYPYEHINKLNDDNVRYNLLTDTPKDDCHVAVGTFPTKNAILDNPELDKLYSEYYKFSTVTNNAGDYMFFGIPTGSYMMLADCDLSDIGIYSQKPYDMIEQGSNKGLFKSPNQFKFEESLNSLTQIKSKKLGVQVYPFWGDVDTNEIGISRYDIDLEYNITPKAFFVGSIFSDNSKDSVNKNCRPRKKVGNLCDTAEKAGTIEMIRETLDGSIEKYDINGGDLIDDNGNWAYRIPMNLDYMVTDEMGNLVPTEDKNRGIPTRAKVRFRISVNDEGDIGRVRRTAKILVPHNPNSNAEIDYEFGENTKKTSLTNFYWNKIYTTKMFIPRLQKDCAGNKSCVRRRTMIGIKDVDSCQGLKNPFPYNKFNGKMNPLFVIICAIMSFIIDLLTFLNKILSWIANIKIAGWRPFKKLKCIAISCEDDKYAPGCYGGAIPSDVQNRTDRHVLKECYRMMLAEYIKIYTFDFYNDWINGSLYAFLLKYKEKDDRDKFCSVDINKNTILLNTLVSQSSVHIGLDERRTISLNSGFVKSYGDEIYYVPYTNTTNKLFATDIYSLGAVFDCDWQGKPKIYHLLPNTTYSIQTSIESEDEDITPYAKSDSGGVLFEFDCDDFDMNTKHIKNLYKACEIGVGLDETRRTYDIMGNPIVIEKNSQLTVDDIESKFIRDALIYLNSYDSIDPTNTISSSFEDFHYNNYRYKTSASSAATVPNIGSAYGNSLYFYFGSKAGTSALDKLKKEYFTICIPQNLDALNVSGIITDSNINSTSTGDGSITLNVSGGIAPYTFAWEDGPTTQNRTNLIGDRVYVVTVNDSIGNFKRREFSVKNPQPISFSVGKDNVIYEASPDGKLHITNIFGGRRTSYSGNTDYFYKIQITGPTGTIIQDYVRASGASFSSLPSGVYSIVVSDYGSPTMISPTKTETISNPIPLSFSFTTINNVCKDGDDGNLEVVYATGNTPFYYKVDKIDPSTNNPYPSGHEFYYTADNIDEGLKSGVYRINFYDSVSRTLREMGGAPSTTTRALGVTQDFVIVGPSSNITGAWETRSGGRFYYSTYTHTDEGTEPSEFFMNSYVKISDPPPPGGEEPFSLLLPVDLWEISTGTTYKFGKILTSAQYAGKTITIINGDGCESNSIT